MQTTQVLQPVYSAYGNDVNLAELVEIFVRDLPSRVDTLRSHCVEEDWESLARVAHQLNECACSYGFAHLGTLAARLEHTCREAQAEMRVEQALEDLAEYSERVRPGAPE